MEQLIVWSAQDSYAESLKLPEYREGYSSDLLSNIPWPIPDREHLEGGREDK